MWASMRWDRIVWKAADPPAASRYRSTTRRASGVIVARAGAGPTAETASNVSAMRRRGFIGPAYRTDDRGTRRVDHSRGSRLFCALHRLPASTPSTARYPMQRTLRFILLVCVLSCVGFAAHAATYWGPRAGISSDPDQLVVGGQVVFTEIAPKISFEPDVELGFGDDVTLVALNGDFHYNFELSGSDWTPYAGFGIGVNFF